ncbi:MAG: hypothetical protein Q8J97_01850, partial [Flavobacteriaceae bacterium]|nr:hypothetical protein [Flavobacteriaceae bacterium]
KAEAAATLLHESGRETIDTLIADLDTALDAPRRSQLAVRCGLDRAEALSVVLHTMSIPSLRRWIEDVADERGEPMRHWLSRALRKLPARRGCFFFATASSVDPHITFGDMSASIAPYSLVTAQLDPTVLFCDDGDEPALLVVIEAAECTVARDVSALSFDAAGAAGLCIIEAGVAATPAPTLVPNVEWRLRVAFAELAKVPQTVIFSCGLQLLTVDSRSSSSSSVAERLFSWVMGQHGKEGSSMLELLNLDAANAAARPLVALALALSGRVANQEAVAHLKRLVVLAPQCAASWARLAELEPERARECLRIALRVNPLDEIVARLHASHTFTDVLVAEFTAAVQRGDPVSLLAASAIEAHARWAENSPLHQRLIAELEKFSPTIVAAYPLVALARAELSKGKEASRARVEALLAQAA